MRTKEQKLTLIRGLPEDAVHKLDERRASLAGAPHSKISEAALFLRAELGYEGKAPVA